MLRDLTADRVFVIAEIGQNHQGDIETAKRLMEAAKFCGVDAVKTQKRDVRALLTDEEYDRPYEGPHSFGRTYGEHREYLELSDDEFDELKSHAKRLGLVFFASAWDIPSAEMLNRLRVPLFKIASAGLTNTELLEKIAAFGKPTIISTGMSTLEEVRRAVRVFPENHYFLMQCTSAYPCRFEDVNLKVLVEYQRMFNCVVGFSGHHNGIAVDVAAVALGARIIERHFTLDRTMKGTDHAASLEPVGLVKLVRDIRAVEAAMGSGDKRVLECECEARDKLRQAA